MIKLIKSICIITNAYIFFCLTGKKYTRLILLKYIIHKKIKIALIETLILL